MMHSSCQKCQCQDVDVFKLRTYEFSWTDCDAHENRRKWRNSAKTASPWISVFGMWFRWMQLIKPLTTIFWVLFWERKEVRRRRRGRKRPAAGKVITGRQPEKSGWWGCEGCPVVYIRLTRLHLVCEVTRCRLVQVRQNLNTLTSVLHGNFNDTVAGSTLDIDCFWKSVFSFAGLQHTFCRKCTTGTGRGSSTFFFCFCQYDN